MSRFKPAFYINITERCNMRCEYCPAYGENWESTEGLLPLDQLLKVIRVAVGSGLTTFRISGGEPFIFPDRVFAAIELLNGLNVTDIILNTNGFNLYQHLGKLNACTVAKVKISLDTIDPELFKTITLNRRFADVLQSIRGARDAGHSVELNCVLYRRNKDAFWPLVDFCERECVGLKILDLVYYDRLVREEMDPRQFWEEQYLDLTELSEEVAGRLGPPSIVRLSNERGIPMLQFRLHNGRALVIKDGQRGSTFGRVCEGCSHFPCQEGLFHLSLSAGGNLTPCRLRRDLTTDLARMSEDEIREALSRALGAYGEVRLVTKTVQFPQSGGNVPVQIGG